MLTLSDIKWCAEECARQNSGEVSVAWMCNALHYAREEMRGPSGIDLTNIVILGQLVEPVQNANGFRKVPVYFKDVTNQAVSPTNINVALRSLLENGTSLFPTQWYKEFEKIHPFLDGNGRVGAILFNLKMERIHDPVTPPNMFFDKIGESS